MAFVTGGFRFSITLMDNGGNTTTKTYEMSATDAATAATDAATIKAAIAAVTDCTILEYHFYERTVNDAATYPGAGVQVEEQALLTLSIADEVGKVGTATIPGPKGTLFVATSGPNADVIDPADAAVVAFVALFQAAGELLISDGEVADSLISGRRIHRASRRG